MSVDVIDVVEDDNLNNDRDDVVAVLCCLVQSEMVCDESNLEVDEVNRVEVVDAPDVICVLYSPLR